MDRKMDPSKKKLDSQLTLLQRQINNMSSINVQQARATSIRSSMSMMEGQMQRTNEEFESHLKELNDKHKKEVVSRVRDFEEKIATLKKLILAKENEIDTMKGRLDEARSAQQKAYDENMHTRKRYDQRIQDLEQVIEEGRQKLSELQLERDRFKSDDKRIETVQKSFKECQDELLATKDHVAGLENELSEKLDLIEKLEFEKGELEVTVKTLEEENASIQNQLDGYVDQCKNQMQSENSAHQVLKEQLSKVQQEYEDLKAKFALENSRSSELQLKIDELNRECRLLKVDIRVSSRGQENLEKRLSDSDQARKELEEKLSALEVQDASLNAQVKALEVTIDALQKEVNAKEKDYASVISIKESLNEQKLQLEADNSMLKDQMEIMKVKVQDYDGLKNVVASKEEAIEEKISQIEMKNCQINRLTKEKDILKTTLVTLDSQLTDFETELEKKNEQLKDFDKIKELLQKENQDIREQLRKVKIELNEAKSLKAFTEKRLEITETTLKTQSESKDSEVHAVLEKLSVASKRNEELSQELSALTTQVSTLEGEKFSLKTNLESLKNEKDRLQKDLNNCIKTVVDLKDENMSLKKGLADTLNKAESYKQKFEACEDRLSLLEEAMKLNEVTCRTKIEQQEKLIDYLCEKLPHEKTKKKKMNIFTPKRAEKESFTPSRAAATPQSRLKGNVLLPPNKVHPSPMMLEQEKLMVEHLEQRRADLRNKLMDLQGQNVSTPLTKKTPTLPTPKKEENVLLKERSNTIAVTHGKVVTGRAHKYSEKRCEKIKKCMACWEPIYKGRPISECEECGYVFHLACAVTAGDTCGLSEKKAYEIEKDISSKRAEPINNGIDEDVRGVVKVRAENMSVAEKRLLVIENCKLKMYVTEGDRKTAKPAAMFPLNEKTTVFFRIDKTENLAAVKEEIAFAMKVTFHDEDCQSTYLYMFHKNARQKRYWIQAIMKFTKMGATSSPESTISSDFSFSGDDNKENQLVKVNEKIIVNERIDKLYVNCAHYLTSSKTYLLGCDDGLYSVKDLAGKPVKIEGPASIYDIGILNAAKLAVFIEGPQRVLTTVYSGLMKSCAEAAECSSPRFTTQIVPHTKHCYMFATRSVTFEDTTVAAACTNGLLLCTMVRGELNVIKQFLMKDNITSLLMTPQTVFFGNNDVYELDTKTFQVEEFLDSTDDAIYYVQIINESHGSYPVAILDVTQSRGPDTKEPEYLICFQDIGIFVDCFGRRSRDGDVLWSHVPLAFEYRHPYLYIVHFTSVEVQKLDSKSYTKVSNSTLGRDQTKNRPESHVVVPEVRFLQINSKSSPNYVGEGAQGVVIALHEAQAIKVMELSASP